MPALFQPLYGKNHCMSLYVSYRGKTYRIVLGPFVVCVQMVIIGGVAMVIKARAEVSCPTASLLRSIQPCFCYQRLWDTSGVYCPSIRWINHGTCSVIACADRTLLVKRRFDENWTCSRTWTSRWAVFCDRLICKHIDALSTKVLELFGDTRSYFKRLGRLSILPSQQRGCTRAFSIRHPSHSWIHFPLPSVCA